MFSVDFLGVNFMRRAGFVEMMGITKKVVQAVVVEGYAPLDEPSRMAIVPQLVIPGRPYTGEPLTPRSAGFAVERALAERELAAAKAADAADEAFEAQRSARAEANAVADYARAASRRAAAIAAEASDFQTAQQEAAAAKASAAAAEAAATEASRAAQLASRKAAISAGFVAASAGSFQVVSSSRTVETFATEAEALHSAAERWWPWILYHEQRGCFTEVAHGGIGLPLAHAGIRRHVSDVMSARINLVMTPRGR